MSSHPIERFKAPHTITAGQPLKELFDAKLVGLIGQSFADVSADFDLESFKRRAKQGLAEGSMTERSAHIADALAAELPDDFRETSEVLIAALGPEETRGEGHGLRSFFYMPHSSLIARHGEAHFEAGMRACYELTQCFTSEFCVRPFLVRHQKRALARLRKWTMDANHHVRRLCSEGSRPRLPWASRLPALAADPELALPILEALKDDPELYVRRSVANHLGDLCKDHPEWVFELCERWLEEVADADDGRRKERHWMIRHAVRLPAKKRVEAALDLRQRAKP